MTDPGQEFCSSPLVCIYHKNAALWYRAADGRNPGDTLMFHVPLCFGCRFHRGIDLFALKEEKKK